MTLNDIFDGIKNIFLMFLDLIHLFFNWLLNVDLTNFIVITIVIYIVYKAKVKLNDFMIEIAKKRSPNKNVTEAVETITLYIFFIVLMALAYWYFG